MKIKIEYVEAATIEQLQEEVSKALEAIQLNIRNRVAEVKTIKSESGYVAQIAYGEIEENIPQVLMEGEEK